MRWSAWPARRWGVVGMTARINRAAAAASGWKETELPAALKRGLATKHLQDAAAFALYRHAVDARSAVPALPRGPSLVAVVTVDGDARWHLSVSHAWRLPTWAELGDARDALLPPDVFLCVPHPPRAYWANFHANTLHLVEVREAHLVEQWKREGEFARSMGASAPSGPRQGG